MSFQANGSEYFSIREVANAAEVTRQTLYRWIRDGKVPAPGYERRRDGRRFYANEERQAVLDFAHGVRPVDDRDPGQMGLFDQDG